MFQLARVESEARKIIGACTDEAFFGKATEAVQMIAAAGEFEDWKGYLDICTTGGGTCVTLPREVGTVIAVNIGGRATLGLDQIFSFHLNGPGDCPRRCEWSWMDQGRWHATYRDLEVPARLVAYTSTEADDNKQLIVHGYDTTGAPLRRQVDGKLVSGILIPTRYGYALPGEGAPTVARITDVEKDVFVGPVRLSTEDDEGVNGVLLGVYEPDETLPRYRRIKLGRPSPWVRIYYRKANPEITSRFDRIPLQSRTAFLSGLRSLKYRADGNLAAAMEFEADAKRLELEALAVLEPPVLRPAQFLTEGRLVDDTLEEGMR